MGAIDACDKEKKGSIGATCFRDFVVGVGIAGVEARCLFMEISKHNECKNTKDEGPPDVVTRLAFINALRHAEGIAAAARLRKALERAVGNTSTRSSAQEAQRSSIQGGAGRQGGSFAKRGSVEFS